MWSLDECNAEYISCATNNRTPFFSFKHQSFLAASTYVIITSSSRNKDAFGLVEVETEEEEEVVRDVGEYFVLGRIILS